MNRKILVFALALIVAAAFSAPMVFAGDPPTQIVIDQVANKKPGVAFDHEKHSGTIDCQVCHHKDKKGAEESCFECHGKDPKAPGFKKIKTNPFHVRCRGCHKDLVMKDKPAGPTKCSGCHKKG